MHKHAAELVTLAPDVILAVWRPGCRAGAPDPALCADRIHARRRPDRLRALSIGLSPPGRQRDRLYANSNLTACAENGWNCSRRSRQALREWPPFGIPTDTSVIGQLAVIQSVAPSVGVDVSPINMRDTTTEFERAVAAFARFRQSWWSDRVQGSALAVFHRDLIVTLAAQNKLPAVYFPPPILSTLAA